MIALLLLAALCTVCHSAGAPGIFHYSRPVGSGHGSPLDSAGGGCVTGVRVWTIHNNYIAGIQLRHDTTWTPVMGHIFGRVNEIKLFDGEVIVQISGKVHPAYIYQLYFVTSRGRSLIVGHPTHESFNMYPTSPNASLILLHVRFNGHAITTLGAQWGPTNSRATIA